MKKFKILIDCPWGKAGEVVDGADLHYGKSTSSPQKSSMFECTWFRLSEYPQLFQEIEEVSDEDLLAQRLILLFAGIDVKKLREQK